MDKKDRPPVTSLESSTGPGYSLSENETDPDTGSFTLNSIRVNT